MFSGQLEAIVFGSERKKIVHVAFMKCIIFHLPCHVLRA